ncbi:RNA polymerase sigma factor [Engelhardtia mirabilis]|uniref:ECF RNA polymerase sigma factor SigE n=1 Tax=Engelhardtia mirabilis TaxID=2528011 RepID=A0A518BEG6_9BACT|nr:ECF RNA polymerase sigma factor SigE [Planctomycetes bacterium Pla133]QDU99696.1 ECF RNA polymerase sigma factor SigE [Planctomycetes bacterium Pla86]
MIDLVDEARLLTLLRGRGAEREAAVRELFELTRTSLFGLALRMTGRPDLADDAVQETFVDVLRGIAGFRGDARLTTWLFRVAVRASTRVASRARGREEVLPDDLDAGSRDPSHSATQRDSAARILRAIAALPAPLRAVVALSALEGLAQTEVAQVLGIPSGTVYSRLHEARARLREALSVS